MELLSCPLCLKPHFQGVDELRSSLITVATSQISCPVCNEILMGLDKLTIHLFSHITHNLIQENVPKPPDKQKKPRSHRPKEDQQKIPTKNDQTERSVDIDNYSKLIEESILTVPKECASKKTLRCDICNFCFSDENILEMHQKLLHQTQVDAKTGHYSYHCHLCSKKFKMRGSLMVHLRVAHYGFANQEAEVCLDGKSNKSQSSDVIKSNERAEKSTDGKHWVCEVCAKQFTTKYFLKKHKRLHTGEMPYYCAQCNKSFTFQQSYHKHMLYHSSEKPHLCSECGRAFKELSTLHNHERIHSGERPFVCETCGKSFRQRVSYLVHRRIHTGAMPYKCTACDKSFRYKISQKSHKCPANPPGSVVRAPVLVDKLKEKANEQQKQEHSSSNNAEIVDDGRQSYSVNLYPQQQNCIVRLENKELNNTSSVVNSNLLTTTNTLNLDHKFISNHVNTIIFNSDGQIIGQNFAFDGQNLIAISPKLMTIDPNQTSQGTINNNNEFESKSQQQQQHEIMDSHSTSKSCKSPLSISCENANNINKSPDFLSMVLSPIIPDVQSLCLSNSPTNDHDVKQEPLETINEESFKTLLDGLSNCI